MTKEGALKMLADASRTDKPSKVNPYLTCEQCIAIVESSIMLIIPGTTLDALTVKRVYQVCLNQKRPRYKR